MRVPIRFLVAAAIALLALGACASPDDESGSGDDVPTPAETPTPFRGVPDGASDTGESPAGVFVGEDRLIHVITYGSSSNPAVVRQAAVEGQRVVVQVNAQEGKASTMDYVSTTSSFVLPDEVDTAEPVTFVLGDFGEVTLDTAEPGRQGWVEIPD